MWEFFKLLSRSRNLYQRKSRNGDIEVTKKTWSKQGKPLNSSTDMWGSFIVHVSFLWEILFRKCGEGKYVGGFLTYWVQVGIYINIEVGMWTYK